MRERFIHLVTVLTGQKVTITLKTGAIVTGIVHTATPFLNLPSETRNKYVLKAVVVDKEAPDSVIQPGDTMIIDMENVVHLHLKSIRMDQLVANNAANNSGDEFVTDTEISKSTSTKASGPRELVQAGSVWTSGGKDILLSDKSPSSISGNTTRPFARSSSADDVPINSRAAKLAGVSSVTTAPSSASSLGCVLKGSIAGWDQFKANEELFNVTGSYDESLYTTTLDKSALEADKIARAEKLAREIESTVSNNIHLAEERGQIAQTDPTEGELDEEDRYSGVLSAEKITVKNGIPESQPKASDNVSESTSKLLATSEQETRPISHATKPLNYAQAVSSAKQSAISGASSKQPSSGPVAGFASGNTLTSSAAQPKKEVQDLESSFLFKKPSKSLPKNEETAKHEQADTVDFKSKNKDASIVSEQVANEVNEKSIEESNKAVTKDEPAAQEMMSGIIHDMVPESKVTDAAKEVDSQTKESTSNGPDEQTEDALSSAASAKSKLNANAKEFTLNVSAKPYTPPSAHIAQSQQLAPPSIPIQPQHMQQHHQFQPQFFDPNTGLPIPLHALPQYTSAGAHIQPHPGQMPGAHHMIGPHHMMAGGQPHHYPGQYHVMRGYPGQYMDPHGIPQSQQPSTMQPIPPSTSVPPAPPPTVPNASSAPSTTLAIPASTSGANTPVVSDDGGESQAPTSQPQEGSEPQSMVPQQPPAMQQVAPMQWQQQQGGYYGAPMHLPHQGQHQRMGGPAMYPPQQFIHHSQIAAMQQMRQHHMYAPMVGAGGVVPQPPQMRTNVAGGGPAGSGPLVNSVAPAGAMPFMPQSHNHIGGQYQPYNSHSGGLGGSNTGGTGGGVVGVNGYGDDDGQGGFGGRGLGGRGGRVGRGGRGRGRTGRGRSGGRFNNQPYQPHNPSNVVGVGVGSGSLPGNERQSPQQPLNLSTEVEHAEKAPSVEPTSIPEFASGTSNTTNSAVVSDNTAHEPKTELS